MTPRGRFLALSPTEQATWLDPAEQEFRTHGFEAASLNRILTAAGVSKGRSYHYFANKDALYRATLERAFARIGPLPLPAPAPDAAGFWQGVAALVGQITTALQTDTALADLLRGMYRDRGAEAAMATPMGQMQNWLESLIARGQALGAVRGDLPLPLLAEVAFDLARSIDRWFALNAADLPPEEERLFSQTAFDLLKAPFIPKTES